MPRTKSTPVFVICDSCEQPFQIKASRKQYARFCSFACRKQYSIDHAETWFWEKVDKSGGPDACWPWTAAVTGGYGVFTVRLDLETRTQVRTHRYAFELINGPLPDGMFACHHCDNRRCCNPAHLFAGTAKDNTRDGMAKGRIRSVMTPEKVRTIRQLYAAGGVTHKELGDRFGCSPRTVQQVVYRITWKDID